jgi:threonine/homoserine/homoserine lactone efflux protein
MDGELVFTFLSASVLLALMPGPDNMYVLTESLISGKKNGIAISLGLASGVLIHTLAAATGVSIILKQSDLAFNIIKYLGAAYLAYLAYKTLNEKPIPMELVKPSIQRNKAGLYRQGFLMNVLNPKVSLFFIAFLPQFVSEEGFSFIVQMIILGALFMAITILVFGLIAILSGLLSTHLVHPKFWKITKWIKFGVLVVLTLFLVFAERMN